MKCLYYGSFWMGDNDIVNVMADDLAELCEVTKIDLRAYSKQVDERIKVKLRTLNGHITILDTKIIIEDIILHKPDIIILNSGGLCLEDEGFKYLKENNIKIIGLEMSDPDVYPYNGNVYAYKFDFYFTNSKYSFNYQYDKNKVNIKLMPFAASTKHHYYMPEINKIYDVVVVGHAREDRLRIVEKMIHYGFKVGTYGAGWTNNLGVVNGVEHVKAINTGKIYLSFAKTNAEYLNVKVGLFEAMACNTFVITDYMEELNDYFTIDKEVVCYKNEKELVEKIHYYLENKEEREYIRRHSYTRFLNEHTYVHRWNCILNNINVLNY